MKKVFLLSILFTLNMYSVKSQAVCSPNELKQIAVSFLKWYFQKLEETDFDFDIVKNWDTLPKSPKKIYRINFNEVDKYIKALKSSGFLSDTYLRSVLKYHKIQDSIFVKYQQYEDIPIGCGSDLVLQRMEIDENDKKLENPLIINHEINDRISTIELKFTNNLRLMKFYFEKCENKWLISQINEPLDTKLEYHPIDADSTQKYKPRPVRIAFRIVNGKKEMIILKNKSKTELKKKKKNEAH